MIHLGTPRAPMHSSGEDPSSQEEAGGNDTDDDVPDHVVHFHVNPGVTVSLQVGDCIRVVKGPMTVPMVPTVRPSPPPMPMPVQVPVGHMVQQIVDETGQLRHVILSPQHVAGSPGPPPRVDPNQPPPPPGEFFPGFYAPTLMAPPPHGPPPLLHPNHNMMRDDRSNRQYHKLKRRLEHKQQQQTTPVNHNAASTSSTNTPTPPISPTREVIRNTVARESSTSPVPNSDQSAPISPTPPVVLSVSDIEKTSALLSWAPSDAVTSSVSSSEDSGVAGSEVSGKVTPQPIELPSTMYQLMIGKKGPDGIHKSVYFGPECSQVLDNLTPGTDYSVKLSVSVGENRGASNTALTTFTTLPDAPAPPPIPKLNNRTKNSITIKWNAPAHHGSAITQYTVEMGENIKEEIKWKCVYTGKDKQCTVSKLTPGHHYLFRVSATNEIGTSEFSVQASFSTTTPPPAAPEPPQAAPMPPPTPFSLSLCWPPHPNPQVTYTLEMAPVRIDNPSLTPEELSKRIGGCYIPVYHGSDRHFVCGNLVPATSYLFRLKVNTADGPCSSWSSPIRLCTPPSIPTAPSRPHIRGKITSQGMKVRWEQPNNCGGDMIRDYILQIDDGRGAGFCDVWNGPVQEAYISGLEPGHIYAIRVCARNSAGCGAFSEALRANTAPAPPGAPTWHRKQQPPTSHTISLHWELPAYNGGAPITQYEVELTCGEERFSVYRGVENRCDIYSGLSPATKYVFSVRACNVAGFGPWSNAIEMETAVAPPSMPNPPSIMVTRNGASFNWEPLAMAVNYCLELAHVPAVPTASSIDNNNETEVSNPEQQETPSYQVYYSGSDTKYEVKRLSPGSTYLARVQGSNSSGCGPYSDPAEFITAVTHPGSISHAPQLVKIDYDGEFPLAAVAFDPPSHWGGDVVSLSYQLEICIHKDQAAIPQIINTEDTTAEDIILARDTSYRIRVRAVNSVGPGPLSSALKFTTLPHPPPPPTLHLASALPQALRLSWEPANDQLGVYVEMRRGETQEFQPVYDGSELGCKVYKLRSDCEYQFRARAIGQGGEGQPGPIQIFRTLPAPKPVPRGLRVSELTSNSCLITWQAHKPQPHSSHLETDLECYLLISSHRNHDYKKLYRGSELKFHLNKLSASCEYWLKAAFVPVNSADPDEGPFCTPINFTTSVIETAQTTPTPLDATDSVKETPASSSLQLSISWSKIWTWIKKLRRTSLNINQMSDHQKVFCWVLVFVLFSVFIAILISKLIQ